MKENKLKNKKPSSKEPKEELNKININKIPFKFISFIIFLAIISLGVIPIFVETNFHGTTSFITADSLITASTITLLVFTNFAPGNTPSGSIIKRAYWRSNNLTSDALRKHKAWWIVFSAWIRPQYIIGLTVSTTIIELFTNYYAGPQGLMILILSSSYLLFTALSRFIIFHLYQNKNTAYWLSDVFENKQNFSSRWVYRNLLSYFRVTSNYELVLAILEKFKNVNREVDYDTFIKHTKSYWTLSKSIKEKNGDRTTLLLLFISNIASNDSFEGVKRDKIRNKLSEVIKTNGGPGTKKTGAEIFDTYVDIWNADKDVDSTKIPTWDF